jgi:hypothetical protein
MGKLDGQLGLAEAPKSGSHRDLADGGDTASLQHLGEVAQTGLTADKQCIPIEWHARAGG